MPLDIRKLVVHLEEGRAEGGRGDKEEVVGQDGLR
jgi:hypothetical protein